MPKFLTHENLQRVCGGFLAAVERYKEIVPKHFLDATLPEIEKSLQQQLLQATWAQTALNFDADLLKMNAWARKYDIFSQQQAMMDFKYLSDRCAKGTERVNACMETYEIALNFADSAHGGDRFAEWSAACWEFQKEALLGSGDGLDVRFLAVYDKDNAHNLATWRECMVATAATAADTLPWCVNDDKTLVCLVKTEGGSTTKTISSIAEIMCSITRERGITEVRLVDHDMSPLMKARSSKKWLLLSFPVHNVFNKVLELEHPKALKVLPDGQQRALHYRFKIAAKDKLNSYKPKELEGSVDKSNLRAAQLGAVFHNKYNQIPTCDWCNIVWEAG
ncbi:Uncharacterized protein SCF082_LOCUS5988 [Durusdinium trenchii]|uniref:Uncharacterized protein n=1 Tax=Durusdinium trenchii TaxID=1381693 RepID=A0ABP0ID00_9DINO